MMIATGPVAGVEMARAAPVRAGAAGPGTPFAVAMEAAGEDADADAEAEDAAGMIEDLAATETPDATPDPATLPVMLLTAMPMPLSPVAIGAGGVIEPRTAPVAGDAVAVEPRPGVPAPAVFGAGVPVSDGVDTPSRPSPRGETAKFAVGPAIAPAAGMMRDVSVLLAGIRAAPVDPAVAGAPVDPAVVVSTPGVTVRDAAAPVAQPGGAISVPVPVPVAYTPPPVPPAIGVAEAAIREQVAAMAGPTQDGDVDGDAAVAAMADGETGRDAGGDPVAVPAVGGGIASPAGGVGTARAVLGTDAALALHVDAARQGAALDAIGRDITASVDAGTPMRFRVEAGRLGPVTVDLTGGIAALAVRMTTQGAEARDRIAEAETRLVSDARAAGVQIASVQVVDRPADARRDPPQPGAQSAPQSASQSSGHQGMGGGHGGDGGAQADRGGGRHPHAPPPPAGRMSGTRGGAVPVTRAASELYA